MSREVGIEVVSPQHVAMIRREEVAEHLFGLDLWGTEDLTFQNGETFATFACAGFNETAARPRQISVADITDAPLPSTLVPCRLVVDAVVGHKITRGIYKDEEADLDREQRLLTLLNPRDFGADGLVATAAGLRSIAAQQPRMRGIDTLMRYASSLLMRGGDSHVLAVVGWKNVGDIYGGGWSLGRAADDGSARHRVIYSVH